MRKVFTIIVILNLLFPIFGQEIDKTYYLLGTLEDYGGRHYAKNNPLNRSYLCLLSENRTGEIKRIEEVINKRFRKHRPLSKFFKYDGFYVLKSLQYVKKINSFYTFNKTTWKDRFGFFYYTGYLSCLKIMKSSDIQQLSFIAGLFLINGNKSDKTYSITLYNAPERFECGKKILLKFGSKIEKISIDKNIPKKYFIEFKPSEKIKGVIDNELQKKVLFSAPPGKN